MFAVGLAGCGGSDAGSDAKALTKGQATAALLTIEDLPPGFTQADDSGADQGDQVGCLKATDALFDLELDTDVRRNFDSEQTDGSAAGVVNKVSSDADTGTITAAVSDLGKAIATCESVDETDDQGYRVNLEIASNETTTTDAADQQVNFSATGTISGNDTSFPYRVSFVVTRVDNSLAVVAAYEVGQSSSGIVGKLADLNTVVVDRLADAG